MNRTECARGHQYDADLYSTCPYCGDFQRINFEMPVGQFGETMPGTSAPLGEAGKTMPGVGVPLSEAGRTMLGRDMGNFPVSGGPHGLQDEAVTRPPRGYERRVGEDNKTRGMIGKTNGIEPVVGWLVCLEGSEKGKDYRLYGRINTVGRDERMDVCIRGDQGITREVHARIGYDPRKNNFHLIPANSSNNTYRNDEPVYVPVKLEAYDVIELGETKLLFVPLCGQKFSWDGGLHAEGKADETV